MSATTGSATSGSRPACELVSLGSGGRLLRMKSFHSTPRWAAVGGLLAAGLAATAIATGTHPLQPKYLYHPQPPNPHPPQKRYPAYLQVTDIAGLVRGAAEGAGLGNAFLSHIAAVDGLFHVVRAFDNDEIVHVSSMRGGWGVLLNGVGGSGLLGGGVWCSCHDMLTRALET
jgi:hypothetical protein